MYVFFNILSKFWMYDFKRKEQEGLTYVTVPHSLLDPKPHSDNKRVTTLTWKEKENDGHIHVGVSMNHTHFSPTPLRRLVITGL